MSNALTQKRDTLGASPSNDRGLVDGSNGEAFWTNVQNQPEFMLKIRDGDGGETYFPYGYLSPPPTFTFHPEGSIITLYCSGAKAEIRGRHLKQVFDLIQDQKLRGIQVGQDTEFDRTPDSKVYIDSIKITTV